MRPSPSPPRPRRSRERAVAWALLVTAAACGDPAPVPDEPGSPPPGDSAVAARSAGRHFERGLVFVGTARDSALLAPWIVTATSRPGEVERTARAWLYRPGGWEAFLDERWSTAPTRTPWRILPYGPMRLVVAETEALERLIYSAGGRELDVAPGDLLVEWTDRRGETFRVFEGELTLAGRSTPGFVFDVARAAEPDGPTASDWAVLVSGDSVIVVMHEQPGPVGPSGENPWRVWARLDFREIDQAGVEVGWSEVRAFEPARRDIPVGWALESDQIEGSLVSGSAELEALEGEGPLLPVEGLFEVTGTLVLQGTRYPVRGLVRHTQG